MFDAPVPTAARARRLLLAGTALALLLPPAAALEAQDWRTVTSTRRYAGEGEVKVDIEYGVGELSVQPGEADILYRSRLRYDADSFRPLNDFGDGRLRLGLAGSKDNLKLRGHDEGRLDVVLGTAAPIDLELKFGAAEARLDLGGIRLTRAHIATGASETTLRFSAPNPERMREMDIDFGAASVRIHGLGNANVERLSVEGGMADVVLDFTGAWRGDMRGNVRMGVGSVTLRLPRGLGVRIDKRSVFAGFDSQGLIKRGGSYFSADWEDAEHRLVLDLETALGDVDVDWVDPGAATTQP